MPELPEVETVRRGLAERIINDSILSIDVRVPKMFVGEQKDILKTPITAVRRVAKVLIIDFSNGKSLLVHFKMTGQLVYVKNLESRIKNRVTPSSLDIAVGGHPEKAYEKPLPHKHTHIIYQLKSGARLYYNDLRKFGWHKVVDTVKIGAALGKSFAGVDITSDTFTVHFLKVYLTSRPRRQVKVALMEQEYLAGLGNIYAAEALWYATIRPDRLVGTLSDEEISKLYKGITHVIDLSLKSGGSTFNSYVDVAGKQGEFMKHAAVYKQKKDPRGHDVKTMKQGGRTTHFCPVCQK